MKWLDKLERKYGKYAIPNLMYYVIILYIVGFVINIVAPELYTEYLALDAQAILHGQIWRIFTFIIQPPNSSYFFILFALYLYYMIGKTLEYMWGAFRFNVFFLMGMVGEILAALVSYFVFHQNLYVTTGFLNFSLFLAFAICFPDVQFYLFMVIPVKAKWMAIAESAVYVYSFLVGSAGTRCEIVLSLANVILFFLMTRNYSRINPKEIHRKKQFKQQTKIRMPGQPRHKCAVCGRTEADGENLEFRYCSKCAGNLEYCQDHLFTHEHVHH